MKEVFVMSLLITLVVFFMLGLWTVDVSIPAMMGAGEYTTFFGAQNPFMMYHLGMVFVITSFCLICFLVIQINFKVKKEEQQ